MPRYHVARSIDIAAAPQRVYDAVADYGSWPTWSPWLGADPAAEVRTSDDPSSVGSLHAWNGEIVGQGEMEHTRLEPGRRIEAELRFVKPFKSTSKVVFELEPSGDGTHVTWHMHGSLPWFLFWMTPMMSSFIGMDYDRGLSMLKEWIETGRVLSSITIRGVETVGPLRVAGVRRKAAWGEIGPAMAPAFATAHAELSAAGLPTDGQSISVYHDFKIKTRIFDFTSGFVIPADAGAVPAGLAEWSIPEVRALAVAHVGSYGHLGNGWSAANQYARAKKLKQSKAGAYELYRSDPQQTPEAELRTEIFLPLK